jgi:hypothetical protein
LGGADFYTEFDQPGRRSRGRIDIWHVGIFHGGDDESNIEPTHFEDLHSAGPYSQVRGQRMATTILAEVLADI